jgi:hypothetical protein
MGFELGSSLLGTLKNFNTVIKPQLSEKAIKMLLVLQLCICLRPCISTEITY